MKKLLLSLSLLASVMVANAQQFTLWNAEQGFTALPGTPPPAAFNNGEPSNASTLPTKNPAINTGLYVDTLGVTSSTSVGTGTYPYAIQATGSCDGTGATSYYIGGFGIGTFTGPNVGLPWARPSAGTNFASVLSNFSSAKLYFTVMFTGTAPQVTLQLNSTTTSVQYGYKFNFDSLATAGSWYTYAIPMSSFAGIVNYTPDYPALTAAVADSLFKFAISVSPGTGTKSGASQSGSATFSLGNLWIGTSSTFTATQAQVAANISSTVVYPNPAASAPVSTMISLQNASQVTAIVTDLTGRQIVTKDLGTVPATPAGSNAPSYGLFDSSSLAKGMYTVTYVVNGTSAKTDLVVVQ